MAAELGGVIDSLNTLTNILLLVVMVVSVAMYAYPDPSVRHNGLVAFLVTLLAAVLTNIQIPV
jgi:hypothetical protein